MMDILISETCWARKKWSKITSDIKLVFYSSTHFNITIYTYISQALSYIELPWSKICIQLLSRPCLLHVLPICSYFISRRDINWWRFQPLYYNRRLHCSLRKCSKLFIFFCSAACLKFAATEGTFYRWYEQRSWARHVAAHVGLLCNTLGMRLSAIGRTLQLLYTLQRLCIAFILPTPFHFAFPPFSFSLYFPLKHSFHHSVSW